MMNVVYNRWYLSMKVPFSWYAMLSNIILSDRRDTFISDICQQKAEMGETF